MTTFSSPLGLLAGNGAFPAAVVEEATARGLEVVVVAHRGETDPSAVANAKACCWIAVGQLGKAVKFFLQHGVQDLVIVGGINKSRALRRLRPDWLGLKVLSRIATGHDDAVLRIMVQEFEARGLHVLSAAELLPRFVPVVGQLTSRGLDEQDRRNAVLGWRAARTLGALDVGQGAVVSREMIIALEAIEGTDALLERAATLAAEGGVLVKVCKPQQDERVDLPSVGPNTIVLMARAKLRALVLEAGRTMMVDPQQTLALAERHGIRVVAVQDETQL